jgi:hypothetical protein
MNLPEPYSCAAWGIFAFQALTVATSPQVRQLCHALRRRSGRLSALRAVAPRLWNVLFLFLSGMRSLE